MTTSCATRTLTALALLWATTTGAAMADEGLRTTLEGFLLDQAASLPGEVSVDITLPNEQAIACHSPEPFLPGNGRKLWGRTTVGVHCPGDQPGTRYFQAYVSVNGQYLVAAHDLSPGSTLKTDDVSLQDGDLTRLSRQIMTADQDALGQVVTRRVAAGMPLQSSMLKPPVVVTRGSHVDIIARGQGFTIHAAGTALASAGREQTLRVRTDQGKILSGVAVDNDTVEVR